MRDDDESSGDAARAFEDLRAEVSVLRRSVELLPEQREANRGPDYTKSLGQITQGLSRVVSRLQLIEQHPALKSTPAQYQAAILAAGRDLMSQGVGRFDRASATFEREHQYLAGVIGTVRAHGALTACREAAQRTKKEQHCAIVVPAPARDPAP